MIQIKCPKCQMLLQLDDRAAGTIVGCSGCGQQMRLGGLPVVPMSAPAPRVNAPVPAATPPPRPLSTEASPFAGIGSPAPATGESEGGPDFGLMVEEAKKSDSTDRVGELWAEVPQPLPAEVAALGNPLDAFRSEGRNRKLNRLDISYFAIWLGVSGTALLIAFRTKKLMPVLLVLAISGAALAVLLTVTFFRVGAVLMFARTYRVFVFQDALVHQDGTHFRDFSWDAIEYVEYSSVTDVSDRGVTRVRHWLVIADRAESLELDEELIGVERLAVAVLNHASRRQLEPALEALRDGQSLQIGSFRLDLSGLEYRDRMYRWHEFGRCVRRKGRLCFSLKFAEDYCIEVETAKVPRSFLIHAIAQSFIVEDR
jgi:hypothetical protein